jgi:hypothetical protein
MSGKGLQPICLVLAIVPSVLCVFIVALRVWTRCRSKKFATGMLQICHDSNEINSQVEDTLLVVASVSFSSSSGRRRELTNNVNSF